MEKATIFTQIIERKCPAYIVAEDEAHIAFLDIAPERPGHTLVVPKRAVDRLFDLADEELAGLIIFSKKVAKGIASVVPCERIGLKVQGLEVPHAHIHLIPVLPKQTFDLLKCKPIDLSKEEMEGLSVAIKKAIDNLSD